MKRARKILSTQLNAPVERCNTVIHPGAKRTPLTVQAALAADSRTPADSNLEEMDALWNQAKAAEKQFR